MAAVGRGTPVGQSELHDKLAVLRATAEQSPLPYLQTMALVAMADVSSGRHTPAQNHCCGPVLTPALVLHAEAAHEHCAACWGCL